MVSDTHVSQLMSDSFHQDDLIRHKNEQNQIPLVPLGTSGRSNVLQTRWLLRTGSQRTGTNEATLYSVLQRDGRTDTHTLLPLLLQSGIREGLFVFIRSTIETIITSQSLKSQGETGMRLSS